MAVYYGFNPPFVGGIQGVMTRQEDKRLVANDLLQLLMTIPGERIHRPEFGTTLRSTVFDQLDDYTLTSLEKSITNAILTNEPRIVNPNVIATGDHPRNSISITVSGTLSYQPDTSFLIEVTLNNSGIVETIVGQ